VLARNVLVQWCCVRRVRFGGISRLISLAQTIRHNQEKNEGVPQVKRPCSRSVARADCDYLNVLFQGQWSAEPQAHRPQTITIPTDAA
jgi:hypothetical protein